MKTYKINILRGDQTISTMYIKAENSAAAEKEMKRRQNLALVEKELKPKEHRTWDDKLEDLPIGKIVLGFFFFLAAIFEMLVRFIGVLITVGVIWFVWYLIFHLL